jgi:hypothetical protein
MLVNQENNLLHKTLVNQENNLVTQDVI